MTLYIFYFLSFLAVLCALMVVISKNPVHSVLYLVLCFFAVGCHYLLLNAQFLAAVHIIVYAGAIMVLFLYVIMMLNLNQESDTQKSNLAKLGATIGGGLLLVVLVSSLKGTESIAKDVVVNNNVGLIKNLGVVLFKDFLLPFEVYSFLFLAGMVGAVMLGKNENK